MSYCLSKDQISEVIGQLIEGRSAENTELQALIESAQCWEDELVCLSYLLTMVLEKREKKGHNSRQLLESVYALTESVFMTMEEFSPYFLDYLLSNVRNRALSLEEELVLMQNKIREHRFDGTIRF